MKKFPGIMVCLAAFAAAAVSARPAGGKLPTEDPPEGALHPLLAKTIEAGPYRARWRSLVTHAAPEWYTRARVGLTAHWGLYSVPGWTARKDSPYGVAYAEWYGQWMAKNPAVKAHHKEHYGDAGYDAFIDGVTDLTTGRKVGFRAEKFNADEWMRLFKKAGAKYFVLTSKHHDGYCLFETSTTGRNSVKTGPRRDLCGEIVTAARRHGLKVGFYYSFYEWFNPHYTGKGDINDYKGCTPLKDADGDGKLEYVDDYMVPQIKELIDRYRPDCLFFDGEWDHGYVWWRGREILAYFYNQAAAHGQEVAANDRYGQRHEGCSGTRGVYGDLLHVEYYAKVDRSRPWAMWRGFGNSFGYNANEDPKNILSREAVVRMIADCAAAGGNTEFNVGPKADGTFPEWDLDRMEAMGEWLAVNGESVYGTSAGPLGALPHGRMTHSPERRTLYYHAFDWPADGRLRIRGIASKILSAKFLCGGAGPAFSQEADGTLTVSLPPRQPGKMVTVIALAYEAPLRLAGK